MQQSNSADNQQATEIEKAWLAGIIDGEGCIRLNPYRPHGDKLYYQPAVYIYNTCPIMMDKVIQILDRLGTGHLTQTKFPDKYRGNRRPAIAVTVWGHKRVSKLLLALMPYLVCKKAEALVLYRFCDSRLKAPKPSPHKNSPYTPEELTAFWKLKEIKQFRHLREHTPDSATVEKMCSELNSDIKRVAEMTTPM